MPRIFDDERTGRIRAALNAAGLAGCICLLPENVLLVSGTWPRIGLTLAWFPVDGEPAMLAPETELETASSGWVSRVDTHRGDLDSAIAHTAMAAFLREQTAGLPPSARIGYEARFAQMAPPPAASEPRTIDQTIVDLLANAVGGQRLRDATNVLYGLRARKTAREIEAIRRANAIAAVGVARFYKVTAPGQSEIEIAAEVERAIAVAGIHDFGATTVRAWAQLSSGTATVDAWRFYVQAGSRRLQAGDLALLELGTVVDGFWSDLTRVTVAGEATAEQRAIWQIVADAQQAAVDAIRPGQTGRAVDAAARTVIVERGYGERFIHGTGHGLGFRYHEPPPLLTPTNEDLLEAGMVTSVEPGIYIPGWGGIRIEDNILVTENGAERLSPRSQPL